ncbi:hypothetical protein BD413DRAFT_557336 [Trametes elegans]|nr:hypothetical protein BD413DRAFT_557336 [Trametes elegans]
MPPMPVSVRGDGGGQWFCASYWTSLCFPLILWYTMSLINSTLPSSPPSDNHILDRGEQQPYPWTLVLPCPGQALDQASRAVKTYKLTV